MGTAVGVGALSVPLALNPTGPAVPASTLNAPGGQLTNVGSTMGWESRTVPAVWSTAPTNPPRKKVPFRWTTSAVNVSSMILAKWTSSVPVRSVHEAIALPPPHAPAEQVSPVVQSWRSSQAAPSGDGVHTDGSPAQV